MNLIHHSQQYPTIIDLRPDAEKLKLNGYIQINKTDELKDFQFQINGPRGLNTSRFEGPEAYFLDWKHPVDSKVYCLCSSCGKGLQTS